MQCLLAVSSILLASKETSMTSFRRFCTFYEDSLPSPLSLDAEMTLWQRKWERQDPNTVPTPALATLKENDHALYPNVAKCLKIFVTLPVTTCEKCVSFEATKDILAEHHVIDEIDRSRLALSTTTWKLTLMK